MEDIKNILLALQHISPYIIMRVQALIDCICICKRKLCKSSSYWHHQTKTGLKIYFNVELKEQENINQSQLGSCLAGLSAHAQ